MLPRGVQRIALLCILLDTQFGNRRPVPNDSIAKKPFQATSLRDARIFRKDYATGDVRARLLPLRLVKWVFPRPVPAREFKSLLFRPHDQIFEHLNKALDGNLAGWSSSA
jgi:hypothetical protein